MAKKLISSSADALPVPVELIERRIYVIRGQKVMLDSDLAELYQVPTKRLNEAVRRNRNRFPEDFMFQLTTEEAENSRSQFATSSSGYGGRRYLPYAFTEHGVAMLSSVLRSDRAVQMNILIVRAFVKLRELLASHKELARKIDQLEADQKKHAGALQQHASILVEVVKDIQRLKHPPITRAIGFRIPTSPKKK
ncbi:MAG TPA: ORF6N domain-containing protein [Bryobacteraceae bacterium]|nr:ORF6N domain-containing protein [Bryobacteraceae bacterium]